MATKANLLKILQEARAVEVALVENRSDREKEAVGSFERWSLKDMIAHVLLWREKQGDRLEAARGGTPAMVLSQDGIEAINQEAYDQFRDMLWPEVWARSEKAFTRLLGLVENFSDEELFDPDRYPWLEGRPLWRPIAVNGFAHPLSHISERYLEEGDRDKALEIERFATEIGLSMDVSPGWRGGMWYNLACFYVKIADYDAALTLLQEAFILNPALKEWGRQDPDLLALQENPEFLALYPGA